MEFSWDKLLESLKKFKELVLATIIDKRGSTPRGVNTSMIVLPNGKIFGTIGGGPVENEIINEGLELIKDKKSKIIDRSFTGDEVICGGRVTVLMEYFGENDISFLEELLHYYQSGNTIYLSRNLKNFSREIVKDYRETNLKENIFVQEIKSPPELHIFGGGHIAIPLCKMAALCDFSIYVYDDREDFATKERFPDAEKVVCCDFNNILPYINLKNNSFIVLVTREHAHDEILLKQLLGKPYKYLGMIGSKKRVSSVKERLIKANFDKNEIERIYSPIGLKINSETPAEIAISILSEIIMVKNG